MTTSTLRRTRPIGWWCSDGIGASTEARACRAMLGDLRRPVFAVESDGGLALCAGGSVVLGDAPSPQQSSPLLAYLSPQRLEDLGDPAFCRDHGIRFPYVAGAMANGIASVAMVEAMARAGMLGFFGAAGLPIDRVEAAVSELSASLGELPFGCNLIHSPSEPELESAVARLFIRQGVRVVSASAFMGMTLPIVRYRTHGIHLGADGGIVTPHRVVAKVSRVEVATKFFSPPPDAMLRELVREGALSAEQARLAARVPVAQDLTAEADSGGHTDNRPAITLLPTLLALRDRLQAEHGYAQPLRVGAAGGISTPASAAAAFALGAAYVVTGSVNQSCREAGTSDAVRRMLAEARQADIAMAPAADMFEMGVKVQVLKRGTMFPMRAAKLYELYRSYGSLEEIPAAERRTVERTMLRSTFGEAWEQTRQYFEARDPARLARAEADPRQRMALVFRSYLGQASRWANAGEPSRQVDYQIWCGPAMGAFNEWVRGSFLEPPSSRDVVTVALNILYGAAVHTRLQSLRSHGCAIQPGWRDTPPLPRERLEVLLDWATVD